MYFLSSGEYHEYLKVNRPFENESITKLIQYYLLDRLKRKTIYDASGDEEYTLSMKLVVNDFESYDTADMAALKNAVSQLSEAKSYVVDLHTDGSTGDICIDFDDDTRFAISNEFDFYKGLYSLLCSSAEKNFVYKNMMYYRSSGEYSFDKIDENGIHNLKKEASIVDGDCDINGELYGDNLFLEINYDIDGYLPHTDKIKAIIEKYIKDEYELDFCREMWEDEKRLGLSNIQWFTDVDTILNFVDEINSVLDELPTEYILDASGKFFDYSTFTLVFFDVIDNKFVVRGIQY